MSPRTQACIFHQVQKERGNSKEGFIFCWPSSPSVEGKKAPTRENKDTQAARYKTEEGDGDTQPFMARLILRELREE